MIVRQILSSLVILVFWGTTSFAQTAEPVRVAVLPFEIYSNLRSAGLQKMITQDLSKRIADEEQVKVVDHSTITTLLDKTTPTFSKSALLDIAEKLEADFLVLGSVTKIGENLSLDTYLFNPRGTPSFSKSFTEGKNLTVLVREMAEKISSQVLKISLSNQKAKGTEEKVAFEAIGDTEPVASAVEKTQEASEKPAGNQEVAEGPVVAYAETDSGELADQPEELESGEDDPQLLSSLTEEAVAERGAEEGEQKAFPEAVEEDTKEQQVAIIETQEVEAPEEPVVAYAETDSGQEDRQPSGSLTEAVTGEMVAEEGEQKAFPEAVEEDTKEQQVAIIETQEVEVPEEPVVAYADTDSGEWADQPEELESGEDDPQLLGSLTEEAVAERGAEEGEQKAFPEAVEEEERDVLSETPEEEEAPATVALLTEPEREETDSTEKESEDKSFSSPFSTLKPVKITSKTMEADNKRNMVTFKGNVVVKQEDVVIFSDTMKVSYEPKGGIKKVEASGNVKMSQENRIATGKKLVFYNPEQKIVMTGSPKIWQGDNLISCEKVTVLLEDNKIVFEGKVDSIIYPRSLQEEQKEEENQVEEITIPPLGGEPAGETVVQ